ncbi:Cytochrome P450 86B1 [Bienertia sinuspersici]
MNKLNNNSSFPATKIDISSHAFSMQDIQTLEIFLAIAVFIMIHSLRQKKYHGLPVWPIVGMFPSLIFGLRKNIHEWLTTTVIHQNGTFYFKGPWFSNVHGVVTSEPRNLEYLLKSNFSNFPKGDYFRNILKDFLGDGIFNADNDTWQKQRKTASIEFHSAKFRQLSVDSLLELVHQRLIPVLEEESLKKCEPIDLQDVLLRLTFDNVCMIAFGVDPGCLSLGLSEVPFACAFEQATEATVLRFLTPTCIWKTMRYLNIGVEKKLKESITGVNKFADEVIRTRKKELALEDDISKHKSDLLTVFMRLKDENGNSFSDKFLRDICVNFILAGRDTSSVALSWFFWLLDQHPHIEEKILEEICRIIRERDVGELKKVAEDDVFPDGTVLKKGTNIIYTIYAMGRMEAIWGKDCREYKPERWLKDGRFMSESAYKFTAFNGGPRLCLGKDFANYQMKFVAASIMYRYHVKVAKNHPVEPKFALTMYLKHGLKINLIRRDEAQLHKYLRVKC